MVMVSNTTGRARHKKKGEEEEEDKYFSTFNKIGERT